jgi:glycosyltransferase involved in cell wall biosynthesis
VSLRTVVGVAIAPPWPAVNGGLRRAAALFEALAAVADVHVLVAAPPSAPDVDRRLVPDGIEVRTVARSASPTQSLRMMLRHAPERRPLHLGFYDRPEPRRALAELVDEVQPDAVVTHHLGGVAILDGSVPPEAVALDLPDDDVLRFRRLAATAARPRRWLYAADVPLLERWLASNLHRYRLVSTPSPIDAAALRRRAPGAEVLVVANGTDLPAAPRPDPGEAAPLLFVGDLDYLPNREGLAWFVDEVVADRRWTGTLRVVGRGSAPVARGVEARGFVDDLQPEWDAALAAIVPLRAGGGTRLKVVEAFGQGVPVISTGVGAEGLDAIDGTHYLRADTPDELREAIAAVRADRVLRDRLASAARTLAEERFTWARTTAPLVEALRG